MVSSFLGASVREGGAVLRGDPEMPAAEIARRHAVCRANICGQYLAYDERCAACGCDVPKKIAWRTASCPEGHWPALTPVRPPADKLPSPPP